MSTQESEALRREAAAARAELASLKQDAQLNESALRTAREALAAAQSHINDLGPMRRRATQAEAELAALRAEVAALLDGVPGDIGGGSAAAPAAGGTGAALRAVAFLDEMHAQLGDLTQHR
jgi:hypothetical protein